MAVLYPEVIKKLVELMDGDFYVVFSSVHEALIHSSKLCSLEEQMDPWVIEYIQPLLLGKLGI